MSELKLVEKIKSEVERITKKLTLPHASFLTKSQFHSLSKITEWELRKVGGLQGIITAYFPFEDKDLGQITSLEKKNAYINKLEKKVGTWLDFKDQLTESLVKNMEKLKVEPKILNEKATKEYIEGVKKTKLHDTSPRSVCVALTDLHFGTNVDPR